MTLNKVKTYTILVLFLFLLIVIWQLERMTDKRDYEHAEKERHQANEIQLLGEKKQFETYKLRQKELSDSMKSVIVKQAKELKIKPKQIEKIVYRDQIVKDTVIKEVPVQVLGKNQWSIKDFDKCWFWQGIATLTDDSLNVKRTGFSYQNKTTETYYRQRPKKFLFIRFGKWTNFVQSKSDCGTEQTRTFEFIK